MSASNRSIAGASNCRGRYGRLSRVFLMSGLGAIVLGAAFWPPDAVQRRLAVRLSFADGLSETDRQAKLAEVEATVADASERALWAAEADAKGKPKAFVFAKLASFLPTSVRAESTLVSSPLESDGKLLGVEIALSDSDSLRAERFAHAIVRSFDEASVFADPVATPETTPQASESAKVADREQALASIRREQDRLRKALDEHFEELRSLRSELADETGFSQKSVREKQSTADSAAARDVSDLGGVNAQPTSFNASTLKNVLWQVSPSLPQADIERRLADLDADIAAKKAAQKDLLSKFTAHHPVATALGVAIERLERDRRELAKLFAPSNDPVPTPPAQSFVPPPVTPDPVVPQPVVPNTIAPQPIVSQPVAPQSNSTPPESRPAPAPEKVTPEAKASPTVEEKHDDEAAKQAAAAEIAASKQAVAAALERAIRSEEIMKEELRSLSEAAQALSAEGAAASQGTPATSVVPAAASSSVLRAEIVDLEETGSVQMRFALLLVGSLLFAGVMTALAWLVGRERAIGSAEEVRLASGLPVVGQSTAGLLDRKPKRNVASVAVSSSLKLVEGAAFATAVFCVAALAAENPRCEQILRQPLAIAWQALQSLT